MKRSHKKILDLLRSGHWFKRDEWSSRTQLVYRNLKFIGTVRQATIDEMMKIGLLKIGVIDNTSAYVPATGPGGPRSQE